MKTLLLSAALLASFSMHALAQCNPAVPSAAVVVNSTQTINGGFDPIWVCSNDTLHSDGGFHKTFLEPGAVMTTSGGIDTIYVKAGASFFMNGGIHVIYYINLTDLNISGGIPTQNPCVDITFDYTNAPANGCVIAPLAAFQSSDSAVCNKTCISFSNLSANAASWEWLFPGGSPSTSTDENPLDICYNTPGVFDVTLIATNGNSSDTLTLNNFVTVYPQTIVPALTQSGDTLFSSQGYDSYQWFFEDTIPINGATNYFYVATQDGSYIIIVTDSNGCQSSALINAINTGMDGSTSGMWDNQITVFPNPAHNSILIISDKEQILQFFDLPGRNIFSVKASSSGKTEVDISMFPTLFFVRTENGGLRKVIRN